MNNIDITALERGYNWAIQRGYTADSPVIPIVPNNAPMIISPPKSPIQSSILKETKSPPTVFESMLVGTVPCTPVYEDAICAAVLDANPQVSITK